MKRCILDSGLGGKGEIIEAILGWRNNSVGLGNDQGFLEKTEWKIQVGDEGDLRSTWNWAVGWSLAEWSKILLRK